MVCSQSPERFCYSCTSSVPPCSRRHATPLKVLPFLCVPACEVIDQICPVCGRVTNAGWGLAVWGDALFPHRGQKPLHQREMMQTTQVLLLIHFSIVNCWELQQWSALMSFLSNTWRFLRSLDEYALKGRANFMRYGQKKWQKYAYMWSVVTHHVYLS